MNATGLLQLLLGTRQHLAQGRMLRQRNNCDSNRGNRHAEWERGMPALDPMRTLRHHVETCETLPMGVVKVACTIAGVASPKAI